MRFFGSGDIKLIVREHLERGPSLEGLRVVDIPAGSGDMTDVLRRKGAEVEAYDLFPEFFRLEGVPCRRADLGQPLPIPTAHADLVLCQEGIEHLADPLHALREFNRILRPGGRLLLTTPNFSNLRSRLSHFLLESDLLKRLPENELTAVWFSQASRSDFYFGHVFLIGAQKLRILGKIAGLRIARVLPTKVSESSLLLGVFYPLIGIVNIVAYLATRGRHSEADPEWKREIFGEILRLNLHPEILLGKHLFLEFEKERELAEVGPVFYNKLKGGRG